MGRPQRRLPGSRAGVRDYIRTVEEAVEDYHPEVERLIDAGDQVVTLAVESGRGRGSGAEVQSKRTAHVWTLRDGIDAGEHVVSVVTRRGRGRTSGVEVEARRAGVWTIREGRVVKTVWFPSVSEALKAVGLEE